MRPHLEVHQVVAAFTRKCDPALCADGCKLRKKSGEERIIHRLRPMHFGAVRDRERFQFINRDELYRNFQKIGNLPRIVPLFIRYQRFVDYGVGAQVGGCRDGARELSRRGGDRRGIESAA